MRLLAVTLAALTLILAPTRLSAREPVVVDTRLSAREPMATSIRHFVTRDPFTASTRLASQDPYAAPLRFVDGYLVLHHWPGSERLARRLLEHVAAQPPLPALPSDVLEDDTIHVFLAPDEARFQELAGGRAPDWGAGLAFPAAGVIVLPGYISSRAAPHDLARILRHELAHIALHRYLAPARPPRWFDEGYSRWAAGEWDLESAWQLRVAFALDRAPPLDSLSLDWPRATADARIAYLLSTTAVVYLVEQSGERGLRIFLERWREEGAMEPALRATYGFSLGRFEEAWRRDVRSRYGWALFFSHSLVFWAIIGTLLLLLSRRRRRRNIERLERMRAEELPDSPAFWLGHAETQRRGGGDGHAETQRRGGGEEGGGGEGGDGED